MSKEKKKKPLNTLLISKTQQKNNKDSEKKIIPNTKSLFSQKVGLKNQKEKKKENERKMTPSISYNLYIKKKKICSCFF